jgi:hypothetical protein
VAANIAHSCGVEKLFVHTNASSCKAQSHTAITVAYTHTCQASLRRASTAQTDSPWLLQYMCTQDIWPLAIEPIIPYRQRVSKDSDVQGSISRQVRQQTAAYSALEAQGK